LIKKSSKKNQEQTIALALCFFLYGQPFLLAVLKVSFFDGQKKKKQI